MVLADEILKKSTDINYFAFLSSPLFKLFLTMFFVLLIPILIFVIGYNRNKIRGWFLFIFKRELFFKATIIMPNRQRLVFPTILENGRFTFMKSVYIVDVEKLLYEKSVPVGFWFYNNPAMIVFNPESATGLTLNAHSLEGILDDKMIDELVRKKDNSGTLMTIIIIILCVLNFIASILFNSGIIKIKGG